MQLTIVRLSLVKYQTMSCENLQQLLSNLAESLPQNSLNSIIAVNLAEKLEMECKEFSSSMRKTVNRSLLAAGALDDAAKEFANCHYKEAEIKAFNFVIRTKQI